MKNTIYSNRLDLNNWEILGIQSFFNEYFELKDFVYCDKTIHADVENDRLGIYKISHGEDVYITKFSDDKNTNYRLNLGSLDFHEIDEDFNFIKEHKFIFNPFN